MTKTPEEIEFLPITITHSAAINEMRDVIHDWAKKKGWCPDRNKGELIALMHSELSEALEAIRFKTCPPCPKCARHYSNIISSSKYHGEGSTWECQHEDCGYSFNGPDKAPPMMDDKIPNYTGEAAELADCVIRILDYCGAFGIDLGATIAAKHEYNITRPHRHGNKNF